MTKAQRIVVAGLCAALVVAAAAIAHLAPHRSSSQLAGAVAYPNFQASLQSGRQLYVDAEQVALGGGAGADWTPTKAPQTTGLWIGGTGIVKVDMAGGSTGVSIAGVPVGELHIAVTKVYDTTDGTTATAITALY